MLTTFWVVQNLNNVLEYSPPSCHDLIGDLVQLLAPRVRVTETVFQEKKELEGILTGATF